MKDEMLWLQLITEVGNARSRYIEAIQEAKAGNYDACNELLKQGNDAYAKGYRVHVDLIRREAGGEKGELSILLVHGEDLLMSAESFKILCQEFLDVYKRMEQLQNMVSQEPLNQ